MIRALPLAALFACAPTPLPELDDAEGTLPEAAEVPYESPVPVDAKVGPLVLAAGDVHPGGYLTLDVANADPGETVAFASSLGGAANGPCLASLGGLCLNLGGQTVYSGSAVADPNGRASVRLAVPATLPPGLTVAFQAAARRGAGGASSVKSNAAVRTVGAPIWSRTVTVDGSLAEWTGDELFPTTSQVGAAGVTWDATSLFLGFDHPDVATGGPQHWQLALIGTGRPGSVVGPTLGTQTPGLPFEAEIVVRRKADGSYDDLLVWNRTNSQWDFFPGLAASGIVAAESGTQLELSIPRSLVGAMNEVVLLSLYEGAGFESTYAGVPATAFADGYDPEVVDALVVDLWSPDSPVAQNP